MLTFVLVLAALYFFFFFFNDTATTEIYTLSLHDALPISIRRCRTGRSSWPRRMQRTRCDGWRKRRDCLWGDRKSTRLNSSHGYISYAVFCLKKKKKNRQQRRHTNHTKNGQC